jgi:iron transport multicopper oxidase
MQEQNKALVEADLHPLSNPSAPGDPKPDGADVTFNLTMGVNLETFRFSINNQSYTSPTVPVLLQILSGARSAQELMPTGGVLTVERNKVVQINIASGLLGGPHPFHLHGVWL